MTTTVPENPTAPDACGGATTVTWNVSNNCGEGDTCTATFTVNPSTPADLVIPANYTGTTCMSQTAVNNAFSGWLDEAYIASGCGEISTIPANPQAPSRCGGTVTVEWTVTSECETEITESATFTIPDAPLVEMSCPMDITEATGQTQDQIDAKFAEWLADASFTGGCNAVISNNNTGAP
ncbi:MAG: hypothetical protein GX126_00375 [Bacteroidales bacterium]|nr:hypothetical protein [Bacteroidales bacterium]